jgi:hypothetical protein
LVHDCLTGGFGLQSCLREMIFNVGPWFHDVLWERTVIYLRHSMRPVGILPDLATIKSRERGARIV